MLRDYWSLMHHWQMAEFCEAGILDFRMELAFRRWLPSRGPLLTCAQDALRHVQLSQIVDDVGLEVASVACREILAQFRLK